MLCKKKETIFCILSMYKSDLHVIFIDQYLQYLYVETIHSCFCSAPSYVFARSSLQSGRRLYVNVYDSLTYLRDAIVYI